MTGTVLVTGATGNTGAGIVRALAGTDVRVRAMVRSPGERLDADVEQVRGDFDDPAAIRAALDGVERAYLVTPSSERAEEQQLRFVDAAQAAGVQRLVVLSQLASRRDSPVRFLRYHAVVEEHVEASGLDHTFLRPNLFFQGLLAMAPMIASEGRFGAPIGDARISAIDVRDIADVASRCLVDSRPAHETLTLTGPAAVTHREIATAIGREVRRDVQFVDTAPDAFAAQLAGVLPPWQVDGLLEDYAHYARGEAALVTSSVADVLGRPARSVDEFVRDYRDAFGAVRAERR